MIASSRNAIVPKQRFMSVASSTNSGARENIASTLFSARAEPKVQSAAGRQHLAEALRAGESQSLRRRNRKAAQQEACPMLFDCNAFRSRSREMAAALNERTAHVRAKPEIAGESGS